VLHRYKKVLEEHFGNIYVLAGTILYRANQGGILLTNTPLTIPVPEAGKKYFGLSRNGSYAAAERGDIPTIKIGKLLRVPVRALEEMLNSVGKAKE
jgi:hypothetical protein